MGVLFAAFLRAPLTSVFMVLEVSGNYSIVAPVILANTVAYLIARSVDPVPIFEAFTRQDGLDLPSMEEMREEARLHIEDALGIAVGAPDRVPILPESVPLREALEEATNSPIDKGTILIHFADGSGYSLHAAELEALGSAVSPETAVGALIPEERLPLLYPDLPLDTTLHFFARWPALLIRNRARGTAIEGVITEADVLACFRMQED
jgi:CIC family chloride channel protein